MTPSRSEFISIRGLRYHVRHWGPPDAPPIFMLHGWMDVSASFQFVVDALQRKWHVIVPDWRGFGLTERSPGSTYWTPDYLADLDAILRHYAPEEPASIVGHSLGGNVAMVYSGVRPHRVAKLVNLEGFGLPATAPEQAPQRYADWLNEEQEPPAMSDYPSQEAVAQRLKKNNPRLSNEKAEFLARHWAAAAEDGRWRILGDPAHKRINPVLYRIDEVLACWSRIAAPVLWVEADHPHFLHWMGDKQAARAEVDRRIASIPHVRRATVENAGHMLHHDQPEIVAGLIESFVSN
jgi:pimeloyl-ACP methyl ester carboxylesterase